MSEATQSPRDAGLRLLQSGDVDGALHQLQLAVGADPTDAQAFNFLGISHARKGNHDAAVRALQEAVRLAPANAGTHYNLAMALQQAQRTPEARQAVQQALVLNPQHEGARQLLSRMGGTTVPSPIEATSAPTPVAAPGYAPAGAPPAGAPGYPAPAAYPGAPASGYGAPVVSPAPAPAWGHAPAAAAQPEYSAQPVVAPAPSIGVRALRGWLWGMLYGQWWTLWTVVSGFIWGHASVNAEFVLGIAIYGVMCAFFGSLAGLIIGLADADETVGAGIAIGAGVIICLLEMVLGGGAGALVNLFFYFFTGRFIGRSLSRRVHA